MKTDGSELDPSEVQAGLDVLIKAQHIKQNAPLMSKIADLAHSHKEAITSIADLKKAYDKAVKDDDADESDEESADEVVSSDMSKKPKVKPSSPDMKESPQDKAIEKRVKENK